MCGLLDDDAAPRGDAGSIEHLVDRLQEEIGELRKQAVVDAALIVQLHADIADRQNEITHLKRGIDAARRIGAAVGILMATRRVTDDAAFALLVHASQAQNRKLRDVADDVALTGTLTP